jgi:hypothetical protein
MFQSISSLALLAGVATAAIAGTASMSAQGSFQLPADQRGFLQIVNRCNFEVHLQSVDSGQTPKDVFHLRPHDGYYHEQFKALAPIKGEDGTLQRAGTSIKLSRDPNPAHWTQSITQIEYSIFEGKVSYDGSNINCHLDTCPFFKDGVTIQVLGQSPSESCQNVTCPKGGCSDGKNWYNEWDHNLAVRTCKESRLLAVYLCEEHAPALSTKRTIDIGEEKDLTAVAFTA